MMQWTKKGRIYKPNSELYWQNRFAMLPTPIGIRPELIRIYAGFCDSKMRGRIGWVDVKANQPSTIVATSEKPILDIGRPGCFDDNGVVPVSIIRKGDEIILYYVGFQLGTRAPYYMFCGAAISRDGGNSFTRVSEAPILDRTNEELFARCGCFVRWSDEINKFQMWYIGSLGDGWIDGPNEKRLPLYTMKYIESKDGLSWDNKTVTSCLEFNNNDEHGFGRPFVFVEDNTYKMYYSIRTLSRGYHIGYAESHDGKQWNRMDDLAGISTSSSGWDALNVSYPAITEYGDKRIMLYNGNACGETGFGYATQKIS